jgi:hypothetical protein
MGEVRCTVRHRRVDSPFSASSCLAPDRCLGGHPLRVLDVGVEGGNWECEQRRREANPADRTSALSTPAGEGASLDTQEAGDLAGREERLERTHRAIPLFGCDGLPVVWRPPRADPSASGYDGGGPDTPWDGNPSKPDDSTTPARSGEVPVARPIHPPMHPPALDVGGGEGLQTRGSAALRGFRGGRGGRDRTGDHLLPKPFSTVLLPPRITGHVRGWLMGAFHGMRHRDRRTQY